MKYKIKLEVYNNEGSMISKNIISPDLTNPTAGSIKLLMNPGAYTNIKSETFIANDGKLLTDNEIVNPFFVSYRIDLN
jgi:hypothetical protein